MKNKDYTIMKKFAPLIVLLLLASIKSYGQQQPQFTQYMYNTIAVNPAYAGSRNALAINFLSRNQWTGIKDGPETQTLSIHSPLRNDKVGLGLSFLKDQLGFESFTSAYGDFSYTIKASEKVNLAFGIKAGATYYKIDEELLGDSDPYFNERLNRWNMNIGAGALLHTNKWYVGLSIPRIINHDKNNDSQYKSLDRVHYYLISGYVFNLGKNLKFKPTMQNKYTKGAPISSDLTATFLFYDKLWLGASYRINDEQRDFGFLMDIQVAKQLRVGYAYEVPSGDIKAYTSGSHEILVIYEFKFSRNKLKSPRYF